MELLCSRSNSGFSSCLLAILLTTKNSLPPAVSTEITRLSANEAVIVGGTGVVTNNVKNQLTSLGLTVERLGGINRFETAAKIADKLGGNDEAILVYANNYPDGLSIAAHAAKEQIPILLTEWGYVPQYTIDIQPRAASRLPGHYLLLHHLPRV